MESNEREEGKKKEGLSKIVLDVQQTMNTLNSLSEGLEHYLNKLEKFKYEVEELILHINAQTESLEEILYQIEDGMLDTCSKCGDFIEGVDVYEVHTPKGKKVLLCAPCYYKK